MGMLAACRALARLRDRNRDDYAGRGAGNSASLRPVSQ